MDNQGTASDLDAALAGVEAAPKPAAKPAVKKDAPTKKPAAKTATAKPASKTATKPAAKPAAKTAAAKPETKTAAAKTPAKTAAKPATKTAAAKPAAKPATKAAAKKTPAKTAAKPASKSPLPAGVHAPSAPHGKPGRQQSPLTQTILALEVGESHVILADIDQLNKVQANVQTTIIRTVARSMPKAKYEINRATVVAPVTGSKVRYAILIERVK